MLEATIVYPHQLFVDHPALAPNRPVFLIEEPLLLNEFPTHRQKLLLHRLSMTAYADNLRARGYAVHYIETTPDATTDSLLKDLIERHKITKLHIVDTTDNWLEARLTKTLTETKTSRIWYESPLFYLKKDEAITRYKDSKKHMARFYEKMRRDFSVLIEPDGTPTGGSWSFDHENRKRLPKDHYTPADPEFYTNHEVTSALKWLDTVNGEKYGEAQVWLPYTHEAAAKWLEVFIAERLAFFGPYEDAIAQSITRLYHSTLSPLINIGLLTPQQVLESATGAAATNAIPIASLEGFVRQILGWREFIRAAYEADGRAMRTSNFWQHKKDLPLSFWSGHTGLTPIDNVISKALRYGYTHHIERLMVVGNFFILCGIHPDVVYRWFMTFYVDAYDWVMVPNVYGMSQFADGGIFATKPYISGSNYLNKMSDYEKGHWQELWDALYWHFVYEQQSFFSTNHRLSMMPQLLLRMPEEKRNHLLGLAEAYISSLPNYQGVRK